MRPYHSLFSLWAGSLFWVLPNSSFYEKPSITLSAVANRKSSLNVLINQCWSLDNEELFKERDRKDDILLGRLRDFKIMDAQEGKV